MRKLGQPRKSTEATLKQVSSQLAYLELRYLIASNDLYADARVSPEVADDLRQYEDIQAQLNALHFPPVAPLVQGGQGGQTLAQQNEEIARLEAEQQRIWQELRRRDPVIASQKQVDPLNFAQIQALIDSDTTALLSFYSTDNDTHIFILRRDGEPQLFTCEGEGKQKLQNWTRFHWLTFYTNVSEQWRKDMETVFLQLSQRLHLNELIAQHLAGIEELIIVPHLSLHLIPFAALPVQPPSVLNPTPSSPGEVKGESYRSVSMPNSENKGIFFKRRENELQPKPDTPYLSDSFRLRIVPSCQILNFCHQREPLEETGTIGIVEDTRENLPFTGYECETLAQLYRIPPNKRLRGKSAKIDPYKTLLQDIQILHSSHHGKSNLNDPLASVLELADGNLTLAQLLTWRFPNLTDAFISACETHLSQPEITDDILTIATGFLCAGARSVVSTQWSVEDFASALLALFYYENRFWGVSRPRALQQAQQRWRNLTGEELAREYKSELEKYLQSRFAGDRESLARIQDRLERRCMEKHPFAHPYFWAGFMSQGLA